MQERMRGMSVSIAMLKYLMAIGARLFLTNDDAQRTLEHFLGKYFLSQTNLTTVG